MTTPGLTSNVNCSVPGCRSVRRKFPHLMYHSFPKSGIKVHVMNNGNSEYVERLKLWIVKLKMGRKVTKSMKVCSLHFNDDDYEQSGAWIIRKRLKQTAVPSRNLPKSVLKNRQKQELQTEQRTSRRLRLQIKMNNCEIKLEQPEFILIKHEPEDIEIKEEVDHIEQEFSTANFDESSYKYKANINNCDDFNFLNMKLKQEELVIKDESDEITEEERSLEIIKFDTNAPKLCIRDHAATSENKVNTVEYFDNSPTHYNQMITVPEHVATSKTEKHPNSKSPNKIEDNNKDEDWIVPEFSTSDLTQGTFNCEKNVDNYDDFNALEIKLEHEELIIKNEPEKGTEEHSSLVSKSDTNSPTPCIGGRIANTKIKQEENDVDHMTQEACTSISYQCSQCVRRNEPGKCSGQNENLKVHKRIHTGEKQFKCSKCQKCFTRSDGLKQHILIHEAKKPFKCQQCDKCFTQTGNLKTHMLIHEGKRLFKCQQCDKSFTQKGDLKRHKLIHVGKKLFKCQHCDKSFTLNGSLKIHMLVHERKKHFKCQRCNENFTQDSSFKLHMLIHEDNKLFKCGECDKCFTRNSNLKEHMFIHSGDRRFKCEVCDKTFTRKSYLQQHMLTHEGKKIFKCHVCDKSFTRKFYLKRHVILHNQETV